MQDHISRQRLHQIRFRDRHNARQRVLKAIKSGVLAPANEAICVRCGEKAEEYHHYLGYSREMQLTVQAMCKTCHNKEPRPKSYKPAIVMPSGFSQLPRWVQSLIKQQIDDNETNVDLAARLGISPATLRRLKEVDYVPTISVLNRIIASSILSDAPPLERKRLYAKEIPRELENTLVGLLDGKRRVLGATLREFAKELGISYGSLVKARRGRMRLGSQSIQRIVQRFPELAGYCL